MNKDRMIGMIGCGNMGEAIAKGIIDANVVSGGEFYLYDIDQDKSAYLKSTILGCIASSSAELVNSCNTILIAVKPQEIEGLLREIWHHLDASKLVISIAAGVTVAGMKKVLKEEVRIVRAMPNVAAFINMSITALCYDNYAMAEDKELSRNIFKSIGEVIEVEEAQMDAVTAVSGSGPAYFFYLTEVLEKSAISMGIDKNKARLLAVKTALGSAALLENSGDAESLRRRVTSKGGTTEAAFRYFSEKKLDEILQKGVKEAAKRSKEISEKG